MITFESFCNKVHFYSQLKKWLVLKNKPPFQILTKLSRHKPVKRSLNHTSGPNIKTLIDLRAEIEYNSKMACM